MYALIQGVHSTGYIFEKFAARYLGREKGFMILFGAVIKQLSVFFVLFNAFIERNIFMHQCI